MFFTINKNTLKATFATLMGFMLAAPLFAAANSQGCLVVQNNDIQQVLMESGKVGQTFVPCESGTLEYITLSVESTSQSTFTSHLTIRQHGEVIASQQFVVPAHGQGAKVKAWMAQPPQIMSGEQYDIELEVPDGHSFFVYYSPVNAYESGRMTVNGLQTMGDLAFEAGVRLRNQRPMFQIQNRNSAGCDPRQTVAEQPIEASQMLAQTFRLCERSELTGLMVQYRAGTAVTGTVEVYKSGALDAGPWAVWQFQAPETPEMTPLFIAAEEALDLDPGTTFEFHFVSASQQGFPSSFQLYFCEGNPYSQGEMLTQSNSTSLDLTFAFEVTEEEENDEEVVMNMFTQHPDHECTVSQPYWDFTHTFTGPTQIEIELPICDDGKMEAVYLPGHISAGGDVAFTLKSDRGKILRTGNLADASQFPGTLEASLEDAPVLFYFGYTLTLDIPEGTIFQMNASTNESHGGLTNLIDGSSSQTELCYVTAMRPYTYDFDEAEEGRNDISLNVYPNPFQSQFTLNIQGLEGRTAVVTLYNFQGTEVYSTFIESQRGQSTNIEVVPESMLTRGYYTLRVEYDDQVMLETIVKQ